MLPLSNLHSASTLAAPTCPQRLILVLDGVPYQTIADLRAEGRFKHFHDPARMISTFPSSTNPAMVEILHAELFAGIWRPYLGELMKKPMPRKNLPTNGAEVAAQIISSRL